MEVAIGTEAAAFAALIAGSGGQTAAWSFEVVRGCSRPSKGSTGESRVPRRDGAGWEDRERDRRKERNREAE